MLSKLLARLKKSPPKETRMQTLSKENLDSMWEEVKLINLAIKHIEQNKNALIMEYGMQPMQSVVNDLRAEKLKLIMKADALHAYLTE